MCRECISKPEMKNEIQLIRKRDHFIFSVESIGQYDVRELFSEALGILHSKCSELLGGIENMENREKQTDTWEEENIEPDVMEEVN